jgi:hypothetical protein
MVAMRVRNDHAVEAVHIRSEQLAAKVRPAVDQHELAGALDED